MRRDKDTIISIAPRRNARRSRFRRARSPKHLRWTRRMRGVHAGSPQLKSGCLGFPWLISAGDLTDSAPLPKRALRGGRCLPVTKMRLRSRQSERPKGRRVEIQS